MKKGIVLFLNLTLIAALVIALSNYEWDIVLIIFLAFVLSFLPKMIEKRYKIDIPAEFEILIVVLVYASIFLGEVQGYYTLFWWWDLVLHAGFALALGFVGFGVLYVLYRGDKIRARPSTIAIFSFCFAVAFGALWEIFEFSMDQIFGYHMQKSGLLDTMWDLIVNAVGAFIASFIGYIYLKRGGFLMFDRLIDKFVKNNPELFE